MIKTLIVDDELFAREEIIHHLSKENDIEIVGECQNAIEALESINNLKPDVVFLDIQMPQVTGIELISMLDSETAPRIVFLTAYEEYAIQAFEENAFDYLLKPVEPERLEKTLARLRKEQQGQDLGPIKEQLKILPCQFNNRTRMVKIEDVESAYSDLTGVHIITTDGEVHTQLTLKVLEERIPLFRVHRQHLISTSAIHEVQFADNGSATITTHSGHEVPVSRRFCRSLKEFLKS